MNGLELAARRWVRRLRSTFWRLRSDARASVLLARRGASRGDVSLARGAISRSALQKQTEVVPLLELLRAEQPSVVAEIGTAYGGTFWLWCQIASPDALLISIDLPGDFAGGGGRADDVLPRLRSYARGRQETCFIREDSHSPAAVDQLRRALDGRSIDFLFIDGDHSYDGAREDFERYLPYVLEGGLVALHDVLPQPDYGVDRLWSELRARFESVEFLDPGDNRGHGPWGGIGVVRKRTAASG